MRTLSLDGLSGRSGVHGLEDLWRGTPSAWRIHMLVTAAAYTVMDELAGTYQALVGGTQELTRSALTQGLALTLQQLDRTCTQSPKRHAHHGRSPKRSGAALP